MSDTLTAAISTAVGEAQTEVGGGAEGGGEAAAAATTAPDPKPAAGGGETAAPPDDKPAAPPREPKPKVEAKAGDDDDEEEEFFAPTAADLEAINKSPELKRVYREMQKGLTRKAQTISAERKTLSERAAIADWVQANPAEAARILAKSSGLSIAEAAREETRIADGLEDKWAKTVGPDAAKLLRPLIEETAKSIMDSMVEPLREQTAQLGRAAQERGIAASVREFGASITEKGGEWNDEIQEAMAKIVNKTAMPEDDTTIQEYLEFVYDAATNRRARMMSAKENLARLRRIRDEQEPTAVSRQAPAASHKIDSSMNDKDAAAMAVRLARQELGLTS